MIKRLKLTNLHSVIIILSILPCCKFQKYESRKFCYNLDFVFNKTKDSLNKDIFYYDFLKILNDSEFVYAYSSDISNNTDAILLSKNEIKKKILNDSLYSDTFKVVKEIWWIKNDCKYKQFFSPNNKIILGKCIDTFINKNDYWGFKSVYCFKIIDTFKIKNRVIYGIMKYDINSSHPKSDISYFDPKIGFVRDRIKAMEESSFILINRKKYLLFKNRLYNYRTINYSIYKSKLFFNEMKSYFQSAPLPH